MNAHEEYERASHFDRRGAEAEAIPHYRRALELGLCGEERKCALLGLGSSLRNIGRFTESVETLSAAVAEFPEEASLKGFLSLSLLSAGRPGQAVATLLELAITRGLMGGYEPALAAYAKEARKG